MTFLLAMECTSCTVWHIQHCLSSRTQFCLAALGPQGRSHGRGRGTLCNGLHQLHVCRSRQHLHCRAGPDNLLGCLTDDKQPCLSSKHRRDTLYVQLG